VTIFVPRRTDVDLWCWFIVVPLYLSWCKVSYKWIGTGRRWYNGVVAVYSLSGSQVKFRRIVHITVCPSYVSGDMVASVTTPSFSVGKEEKSRYK